MEIFSKTGSAFWLYRTEVRSASIFNPLQEIYEFLGFFCYMGHIGNCFESSHPLFVKKKA